MSLQIQRTMDHDKRIQAAQAWFVDNILQHIQDYGHYAPGDFADAAKAAGIEPGIADELAHSGWMQEIAQAIEYFEDDGWGNYAAWLELGERIINAGIDDGHPGAKRADLLRRAGFVYADPLVQSMEFYEIGDGYRLSELFPIGSRWRVAIDMPGVVRGEIVTIMAAHDGTPGGLDDSYVETTNGNYAGLEAGELLEPVRLRFD